MTLIEAAIIILSKSEGSSLSAREITDNALKDGLIKPKSTKPWVQLQSVLRARNRNLILLGKEPQFLLVDGKWKLN